MNTTKPQALEPIERLEADEAAVSGALLKCALKLDWNIHDYADALAAGFDALAHGQRATGALMRGAEAVKQRRDLQPTLIGFDRAHGPDMTVRVELPADIPFIRMPKAALSEVQP